MSIFVNIASYCDPVLPFTLDRAIATADQPAALHFGVADQSPAAAPRVVQLAQGARLSLVRVDPLDARGPCWARALANSLYDGEDWVLQLDSHMDFDPHWDTKLIEQARALQARVAHPGVVVSSYPNSFAFENGQPVRRGVTDKVLVHVVKPQAVFQPDHLVLHFEGHPVEQDTPVRGFHLGAGCLFAPGRFAWQFPYDPWFYFHGEEQALALRLYTHGWDIFHMPGLPLYHLYNNPESGAPPRPLHWDPQLDAQRNTGWWGLEQRARSRLAKLVAGEDLGVFGLGAARTVAEYAAFSGIDYAARTIAPSAYRPKSEG
jgi:hypothetical protein